MKITGNGLATDYQLFYRKSTDIFAAYEFPKRCAKINFLLRKGFHFSEVSLGRVQREWTPKGFMKRGSCKVC